MIQLEMKSYVRFRMKFPFKFFIQLSSNSPFTCISKTVIPDCHFPRNLKFYLHSPHHSATVKLKTLWYIFMDGVQLPQGQRHTMRRQFTIYNEVLRNPWYSQHQGYLALTTLPLSCFKYYPQYQPMEYFDYIGQDREEMSS